MAIFDKFVPENTGFQEARKQDILRAIRRARYFCRTSAVLLGMLQGQTRTAIHRSSKLRKISGLFFDAFNAPIHVRPGENYGNLIRVKLVFLACSRRLPRLTYTQMTPEQIQAASAADGAIACAFHHESRIGIADPFFTQHDEDMRAGILIHEFIHLHFAEGHPGMDNDPNAQKLKLLPKRSNLAVPFRQLYRNPYSYQYFVAWAWGFRHVAQGNQIDFQATDTIRITPATRSRGASATIRDRREKAHLTGRRPQGKAN